MADGNSADIRMRIERYVGDADADKFVASTLMALPRSTTIVDRVQMALYGNRMHNWMYDGASLQRLLTKSGYANAVVLPAGETTIPNPEPLDLRERWDESVYVEAQKPLK